MPFPYLLKFPNLGCIFPNMGMIEVARVSPSNALFSNVQQRVLALIFGNPDHSFYTSEILRRVNSGTADDDVSKGGMVVRDAHADIHLVGKAPVDFLFDLVRCLHEPIAYLRRAATISGIISAIASLTADLITSASIAAFRRTSWPS